MAPSTADVSRVNNLIERFVEIFIPDAAMGSRIAKC